MVSLDFSSEVILIGQAVLIAIIGVLLGIIAKYIVRKLIDKGLLKKIIKDANVYETSALINKVFTEALLWIIIIGFVNYSLNLLGFDFLTKSLQFFIENITRISIFIIIIVVGILIAKFIASILRQRDIENKDEITILTELVVMAAFFLSALEYIGVKATAIVELYKVVLYIIGVIIVLMIVNPKFFEKSKKK